MSAEILRRAAALMRNRANDCALSPWTGTPIGVDVSDVRIAGLGWESLDPVLVATAHGPAAEHIASWHPAVALAVADSLIAAAVHIESHDCEAHCELEGCELVLTAMRTARAYLGSDA